MKTAAPVGILGAGVSGRAAAALARSRGREAVIFDEKAADAREFPARPDPGWEWVVSPGFAVEHPWCRRLREQGAAGIPELEFGARDLRGEVVAVTGSLGKTSMVLLAAELLRATGRAMTVSGNIGTPVSEIARTRPEAEAHLIEASSFQLEICREFRPDRALCLNLAPNHLDRHGDLETYARAKARLFARLGPERIGVWPEGFPVPVPGEARRGRAEEVELPGLEGTRFARGPLRENLRMLFAALSGMEGVCPFALESVIRGFRFPDHRMRDLDIPGAGRVIDDSKSTCLAATRAALASVPGTVHLFMGGLDKGEAPESLRDVLRERNPRLYLFGTAAKKMRDAWQDTVDVCEVAHSLDAVMNRIPRHRESGAEPLLFSPGCASFDQFEGFAHRGTTFQRLVRELAAQHPV